MDAPARDALALPFVPNALPSCYPHTVNPPSRPCGAMAAALSATPNNKQKTYFAFEAQAA